MRREGQGVARMAKGQLEVFVGLSKRINNTFNGQEGPDRGRIYKESLTISEFSHKTNKRWWQIWTDTWMVDIGT